MASDFSAGFKSERRGVTAWKQQVMATYAGRHFEMEVGAPRRHVQTKQTVPTKSSTLYFFAPVPHDNNNNYCSAACTVTAQLVYGTSRRHDVQEPNMT